MEQFCVITYQHETLLNLKKLKERKTKLLKSVFDTKGNHKHGYFIECDLQ